MWTKVSSKHQSDADTQKVADALDHLPSQFAADGNFNNTEALFGDAKRAVLFRRY